jgi:hypothetical protein
LFNDKINSLTNALKRGISAADFAAGFIPGYDLFKAIMNPAATPLDYAIGVLSSIPGSGKLGSLGLKGGIKLGTKATKGLTQLQRRMLFEKVGRQNARNEWWGRMWKNFYGKKNLKNWKNRMNK